VSDGRLRLFVALALPDRIREALVRWRRRLDARRDQTLRPVSPEALHVTLCFLGWQPESAVDGIAAACQVVAAEPPLLLALGDVVWLPPRQPRVLAVELSDAEGALARLQGALSAALATGGWYQAEKRPYLAHVTVARVGGRGFVGRGGSGASQPPGPSRLEFRGSEVVLYRSRLSRSGAQYEALARVPLSGGS
jgi:RNA 2',3'-cyclic 3'-phosphodiesterase